MVEHRGIEFKDCEVELDGNRFVECTFDNVVFLYGGGVVQLEGCGFHSHSFRLRGDLMNGLTFLHDFTHLAGPKAVKGLVNEMTSFLRKPLPKENITFG